MLKLQDFLFEYDDDGKIKSYQITFDMLSANDDYVNGRVVLDAADLDTSTIVQTVHDKLSNLVQSE